MVLLEKSGDQGLDVTYLVSRPSFDDVDIADIGPVGSHVAYACRTY